MFVAHLTKNRLGGFALSFLEWDDNESFYEEIIPYLKEEIPPHCRSYDDSNETWLISSPNHLKQFIETAQKSYGAEFSGDLP